MRKIKMISACLLILCSLASLAPQTNAETLYSYEPEAWQLHRLGLYTGISAETFIPDLGKELNRQLGVTLLLNFLGKRDKVLALPSSEINSILSVYTDNSVVEQWARPYVAYAVKNAMVKGTSTTVLSPLQPLNGIQFATMILRQLGYPMEGSTYLKSLQTLYEKGGLNASEVSLFNKTQLLKDDAVGMVYTSLYAVCSNGESLIENMISSGIISAEQAFSQGLISYEDPGAIDLNKPDSTVPRPTEYDQIYYMILDAIKAGEPSIKVPITKYSDTHDEVFAIVERCVRENPDILYYSGCTHSSTGLLTFQYGVDRQTILDHTRLLNEKLGSILDEIILPNMTDFQKELAIHDYMIDNCDYDDRSYEKGLVPSSSYSAYGALVLKKAVCEGYAEAAKMLLDHAGVECSIVTGFFTGQGLMQNHAWNIVKIGGQYYQLDITFDDPVMSDGSKALYYHYFNLTDNEMKIDHAWDSSLYPACNASAYNYYVVNDLIVKSQQEFEDLVVEKVTGGTKKVTVKIQDYKNIDFDNEQAISRIQNRLHISCMYSVNTDHGIIDLRF
jgi:transglutaminase-like putative cysteine protease